MEAQLDAEYVPFYFHDLRTNEIIAFHAFLSSISDSYSPKWTAVDGFGRMDPAQIYGGTTRSLAVTFQVHAMNGTDFDEMYYKINKLVQLVYPQWSAGTVRGFKDAASGKYGKFTTPFSQIPTASPMIRLRIGDLFSTNYSNLAIARLMGLGGPNFDLGLDDPPKPGGGDVDAIHSSGAAKNVGELVTRLKEENYQNF